MTDAVRAVLFDVDDTLCTYRQSGRELLTEAFEQVGVAPFFEADEYHGRYREFVDESESMRDLRRRCFAAIARERGRDPAVGEAVADAYAARRDHTAVDPTPGAVEAVTRLRERYRVGVVTNGSPAMQTTKLDALGLADAFEVVVHAGYDAPAKPSADPFHAALDGLDADPAEAVYVGNSLASDVAGAHNAGLSSVWYVADGAEGDPDPRPDYRVPSLRDLHDPPWR